MNYVVITPLLIFCLLYLIDSKPINILIDFIFILLSISILFILMDIYDISYISYIIIIIYASALAIIFGFVIMLYNTENKNIKYYKLSNIYYLPLKLIYNYRSMLIIYIYIIFILIFINKLIFSFSSFKFNFLILDPISFFFESYPNLLYLFCESLYLNINNITYIIILMLILLLSLFGVIIIILI